MKNIENTAIESIFSHDKKDFLKELLDRAIQDIEPDAEKFYEAMFEFSLRVEKIACEYVAEEVLKVDPSIFRGFTCNVMEVSGIQEMIDDKGYCAWFVNMKKLYDAIDKNNYISALKIYNLIEKRRNGFTIMTKDTFNHRLAMGYYSYDGNQGVDDFSGILSQLQNLAAMQELNRNLKANLSVKDIEVKKLKI